MRNCNLCLEPDCEITTAANVSSISSSESLSSLSALSLSRNLPYPLTTRYLSIACTNAKGSILTVPPFHCFKFVQSGCRCKLH